MLNAATTWQNKNFPRNKKYKVDSLIKLFIAYISKYFNIDTKNFVRPKT